ncbi:MAG TPA: cytochrome c oxidase assembly protein [Streptosporangiaceae bacterium]
MNMVVSHWSANLVVLVTYLVAAAAHLIGMSGAATSARRPGKPRPAVPAAEAVAFQLGLLVALLALVSPLGYWSYRFVWVRNIQDVLLAFIAPALIVLGAPWLPLARGLGLGGVLEWLGSGRAGSPAAGVADSDRPRRWPMLPVVVTVLFSVGWWVWHLPGPFDSALGNPLIYAAEVVTYLGLGIMLWLQLVGSRPFSPRLEALRRIPLLFATAAAGTALGLIRVFGPTLVYPAYLGFRHHTLSVVSDQQVGGAVLWMIPLVPLGVLAVALCIRWLSDDEESAGSAAGLDRLLEPRKSAWAARPGLR